MGMKGFFISFEGPDGSGKSTQIKMLKNYLDNEGLDTLITREPGGTPIGEAIRGIILDPNHGEMSPITEAYLYAASRAQHVDQVIIPALEQGKVILCDRFVDSSIAYQGAGRGLGMEVIEDINKLALRGIMPDLTLFFDLKPELGLRRGKKRARDVDRLEMEDINFHRLVYDGFCKLCKMYPNRFKRIDANSEIMTIHKDIINQIGQLPKYGK